MFFGVWLLSLKTKKLLADENELVIDGKEKIAYDCVEKIDKTHFDSKGYFSITCKNSDGGETSYKFSSKKYDNLAAVLEHLVTKIS